MTAQAILEASTIPLRYAILCEGCVTILNSLEIRGELCPACGCAGAMLNLARVLSPQPELGAIAYIRIEG